MTSLRPVSQVAMLICAGFLIAWIPYAVVSVVSAFGSPDSVPIPVSVIPTLLAKSSAMYNPIIYQVVDLKHSCARSACFKALKERRHFRKTRYDVCFYALLAAPPTFFPNSMDVTLLSFQLVKLLRFGIGSPAFTPSTIVAI